VYGIGGQFGYGVYGIGGQFGYGVYGIGGQFGYGVYGIGGQGGVYGESDGYAGFFRGALGVTVLGAGGFQLCHNGYLLTECSSSLRYKSDVHPFSGGLDIVKRLRPIAFTWKQDGMQDVGLGAEERRARRAAAHVPQRQWRDRGREVQPAFRRVRERDQGAASPDRAAAGSDRCAEKTRLSVTPGRRRVSVIGLDEWLTKSELRGAGDRVFDVSAVDGRRRF
jgi:hypothetical protein